MSESVCSYETSGPGMCDHRNSSYSQRETNLPSSSYTQVPGYKKEERALSELGIDEVVLPPPTLFSSQHAQARPYLATRTTSLKILTAPHYYLEVLIFCVNDAAVMDAWAKDQVLRVRGGGGVLTA